jgi:glycosyltransferase involved in cell wall biosynthesis
MATVRKVCFVSRKWPPAMGGMETYAKALSDALREHVDVELMVLPGRRDGSVPGPLALASFGVRIGLRLLFARTPAEIVHVADMASWPLAFAARLRNPRGRLLLSAHGTDVSYATRKNVRGRIYLAFMWLGARLLRPATVIANSAAVAEVVRWLGYRDVAVVPLAAEGPPVRQTKTSRVILFSGRLIPLKGCSWFIRAVLPRLPEEFTLHVAGTAWDASEREALEAPRVRYLGRLERDAIWQAYVDALCVVVPNVPMPNGQFEGFCLVAVEAAAAGGVVVAARHGGLAEAVVNGRTGFLVSPGDADAWLRKIMEVASWSQAERFRFTAASRAHCAEHFSWARVARDTFAQYVRSDNATLTRGPRS